MCVFPGDRYTVMDVSQCVRTWLCWSAAAAAGELMESTAGGGVSEIFFFFFSNIY